MKKLLLLALFAVSLIACEERGDEVKNSKPNENYNQGNHYSKEEPDGQDPAIIVPPRR